MAPPTDDRAVLHRGQLIVCTVGQLRAALAAPPGKPMHRKSGAPELGRTVQRGSSTPRGRKGDAQAEPVDVEEGTPTVTDAPLDDSIAVDVNKAGYANE